MSAGSTSLETGLQRESVGSVAGRSGVTGTLVAAQPQPAHPRIAGDPGAAGNPDASAQHPLASSAFAAVETAGVSLAQQAHPDDSVPQQPSAASTSLATEGAAATGAALPHAAKPAPETSHDEPAVTMPLN